MSAVALTPVQGNSNQTILEWIMNADVRMWLPSSILENAFINALFSYSENLRSYVEEAIRAGKITFDWFLVNNLVNSTLCTVT